MRNATTTACRPGAPQLSLEFWRFQLCRITGTTVGYGGLSPPMPAAGARPLGRLRRNHGYPWPPASPQAFEVGTSKSGVP